LRSKLFHELKIKLNDYEIITAPNKSLTATMLMQSCLSKVSPLLRLAIERYGQFFK